MRVVLMGAGHIGQVIARLFSCLQGFDAVINALPYHLALTVATQAKAAGCHYFDLTEDVAATRGIMQLAVSARTVFMPQSGFIRQEQVALPELLANRFGSAYQ